MTRAINIEDELSRLTVLEGRTVGTPLSEEQPAFAELGTIGSGEIFVGSFSGESPWERHNNGNELVHILKGNTTLTIMMQTGPRAFEAKAGELIVVPAGHWHRFHAPDGVSVMTVTPAPTEHSAAADPRDS